MELSDAQIDCLKAHCEGVARSVEGGVPCLLLRGLGLPTGASPPVVDALLRLGDRGDGYATRLFLSERAIGTSKIALNWNAQNIRILERNWQGYSWKAPIELSLEEILLEHLKAFR